MEDDKNMFWGLFTAGFAFLLIIICVWGSIYMLFFPIHCITDTYSYIDPYNFTTVTKEKESGCFTLKEVLENKKEWDKKIMERTYNSTPSVNSSSGSSSIGSLLFNISSASSLS